MITAAPPLMEDSRASGSCLSHHPPCSACNRHKSHEQGSPPLRSIDRLGVHGCPGFHLSFGRRSGRPVADPRLRICATPQGLAWTLSLALGSSGSSSFTAAIAFVPERRVGIAVLTNGEIPPPAHAILFRGLDELLRREPIDWSAEYLAIPPPPGPPSGAPAEAGPRRDLIGRYRCEEYGSAEVRADRNRLVLQLEHHPDTTCQLVPLQGDRYAYRWSKPGIVGGEVAFTRAGSAPAGFELTFAVDPHRYVFTRNAPVPPSPI